MIGKEQALQFKKCHKRTILLDKRNVYFTLDDCVQLENDKVAMRFLLDLILTEW